MVLGENYWVLAPEKGQTNYVENKQENVDQLGPAGRMPGGGDRERET